MTDTMTGLRLLVRPDTGQGSAPWCTDACTRREKCITPGIAHTLSILHVVGPKRGLQHPCNKLASIRGGS